MTKEKEKLYTLLVRFKPEARRRLKWLHKQASNGRNGESLDRQRTISLSDVVNNAVLDYKRDEIVELEERKKRIARESNAELVAIDSQIQGMIEKREREKENELNNAFQARPVKSTIRAGVAKS